MSFSFALLLHLPKPQPKRIGQSKLRKSDVASGAAGPARRTGLATQHARCHKEYYSPRGQAVSTSHFGVREQRPFCVSKAILHFWRSSTPQKSHFFVKFRHLTRATGAPMQTLVPLKLFLYPMDRAEVLHAQSYNISGRRKNTPGENELVLPCEIIDFTCKFYT